MFLKYSLLVALALQSPAGCEGENVSTRRIRDSNVNIVERGEPVETEVYASEREVWERTLQTASPSPEMSMSYTNPPYGDTLSPSPEMSMSYTNPPYGDTQSPSPEMSMSYTNPPYGETSSPSPEMSMDYSMSFPTMAPTNCLSISPEERNRRIRGAILRNTETTEAQLDDNTSPQYKAFNFVCYEDQPRCPDEEQCSFVQRYVMAVFYYSTLGDEWNNCNGVGGDCFPINANCDPANAWLSEKNECEWCGNRCNVDQCITQITLEDVNQSGYLPDEIGDLPFLEKLELEKGTITGPIPSSIGDVSNTLLFLDLDKQQLTGPLPDELWGLSKLTTLDLNDNQFVGTISKDIGNLEVLTFLQMHNNGFTGVIPDNWAGVAGLKNAQFEGNNLVGSMPTTLCALRPPGGVLADDSRFALSASCAICGDPGTALDCCTACN